MSVAKRDMAKVRKFALKMGIRVRIMSKTGRLVDCAYAYFEEKRIVIFRRPDESDLYTLTTLLHEVSHLLNYVINPNDYKEFLKLEDDDNSFRARKIQFDLEKRDISKMKDLHSLLGLKTNQKAIVASELFDIHQYEHNLRHGKFLSKKERNLVRKDIKILAENFL